ncbi:MAG: hypothetical protein HUU29_09850 [Planctomycetaceae bacterium]|nr:hypothetical protein [Planctomycetaceae bacterium]
MLILSADHERLAAMRDASQKAGFNVNCCDDLVTARSLISRYANDYHVIMLDQRMTGRSTSGFIKGARMSAPKSRVLICVAPDSTYTFEDPMVTIAADDRALDLLPRLKREVTRYRSTPVKPATAG